MTDFIKLPCCEHPLPKVLEATTRVQFSLPWPGTAFCWCWENVKIPLTYMGSVIPRETLAAI